MQPNRCMVLNRKRGVFELNQDLAVTHGGGKGERGAPSVTSGSSSPPETEADKREIILASSNIWGVSRSASTSDSDASIQVSAKATKPVIHRTAKTRSNGSARRSCAVSVHHHRQVSPGIQLHSPPLPPPPQRKHNGIRDHRCRPPDSSLQNDHRKLGWEAWFREI